MNTIRPNSLLETLIIADEASLFDNLKEYSRPKQTVLQRAGESTEFVYFPLAGMISQLTVMSDGQSVETAAIGNNSASGFNGALSGRNANCQSMVQLDMRSLRIATRPFKNAYEQSPGVRKMIHDANEFLIEQIQQGAACHALHMAEQRFARWLLQAQDYAGKATLDLTQDFVSEMMAVQRTTVNQVATSLQAEGLITYTRGHVTVTDRAGLEQRACECYRQVADGRNARPALKPLATAPL